jgi:ABC-type sugar transport system ATPase subunit
LAKWLATDPRLLILDEPTRGIDVGAKDEVYKIIRELAGSGMAVLLISSEMPEVLGLSDRIVTMHHGRLTGEFRGGEVGEEDLIRAVMSADHDRRSKPAVAV